MSFAPPQFPIPVRAALGAWRIAQRVGIGRIPLTEDSLIVAARRATGLHDFVDDSFRGPMRRMLRSLEQEANLHPLGRMALRESLVSALVTRLRLEDLTARNPEISEIPVEAPVFVVGLQRTGTTMLHRLLTCEPRLRSMAAWEALNPAPFPGGTDRHGVDLRVRKARTAEAALRYLAPELFAIHPVEADAPEEDIHLLDTTFMSPAIDAILRVPEYQAWFRQVDQLPAYRYMHRLIQLLLWQRDGRWLGKTPHHLEHLDELLTVYPDAKIVITHRDPARTVASFCSMMAHSRAMFCDNVDPDEIGAQFGAKAICAIDRIMDVRSRVEADSFLDVLYHDVVEDPMKEVRRVFDFIGFELAAETAAAMQQWRVKNRQTKHGTHNYRLEDFGLSRPGIDSNFEAYREKFGVPVE
jgi:hypothetical protein